MINFEDLIETLKPELKKTEDSFREELTKIRASTLNPALIEDIEVEFAGSKMPLKSLGAISSVSPRELAIKPWDKSYMEVIVKALERAGIEMSISVDKETIRVSAPPLTGEGKENLIRIVEQKFNENIQKIRRLRDRVWKEIQEKTREGEIREDDKFRAKEKLDELTNDSRKKLEELVENKKREILG